MAKELDTKWSRRDKLAASLFQGIIDGTLAAGNDPLAKGAAHAVEAYALADAFLMIRRERRVPSSPGRPVAKQM